MDFREIDMNDKVGFGVKFNLVLDELEERLPEEPQREWYPNDEDFNQALEVHNEQRADYWDRRSRGKMNKFFNVRIENPEQNTTF